MMDSVIHSAVMAGIFKGLPAVQVSLVAFDTAVVDLTEQADDPTEVLMSVQLGGGTDIAGAVGYRETLVQSPTRTIVVVVTDFFEGDHPDYCPVRSSGCARPGSACWAWPLSMPRPIPPTIARWPSGASPPAPRLRR